MAVAAIVILCIAALVTLARAVDVEIYFYRTTTRRIGIGPVGDSWHEAIGVSGGAFGRAVAVYRLPTSERRWLEDVPE